MSLSEKEVFFSLLRNNHTTLLSLCKQVGVPYYRIMNRLNKGALEELYLTDLGPICQGLGVSLEDLTSLLKRAQNGEFPDDYPREQIILPPVNNESLKDRTIVMLVTAEEKKMIEERREAVQAAVERALQNQKDKG